MELHEFEEYIQCAPPHKREKGEAWQVAIGLQAVDGLKPSRYLLDTAQRDIEGEISIAEVEAIMKTYYESKSFRTEDEEREHEADIASTNIRKLLTENTCAFTLAGLVAVHRRIFEGVFKFAGQIRTYNITKKEWVLRGDTVLYVSYPDIRAAIEYDLDQEKRFDYSRLHRDQMVEHLAEFVSGIWQIHPFGEGNTRTTAVFTIFYLRSLGFQVDNDLFKHDSWYFRNALVRANYQNVQKGIARDNRFLVQFFRNLLLGEEHELRNRTMVVNPPETFTYQLDTPQVTPQASASTPQVQACFTDGTPQVDHNTPQASASTPQVQACFTDGTPQVAHNTPQVTPQADIFTSEATPQVAALVKALSHRQLSVKELMSELQLKDRKNFMQLYLVPALDSGYVRYLYPDKPRHPRQRYLLTVKGMMRLEEMTKE